MKTFTTALSLAACAVLAAAMPAPLPSGGELVARNAACGVHFIVFQTENCSGLSCKINDVLSIHEQVFSPDDDGHNVVASIGGDLSSNFDIGSYYFQNQFQDLLLVTTKNTADAGDYTLHFGFGADEWLSSDPRCTVGKYDAESQSIQGDCSFACK